MKFLLNIKNAVYTITLLYITLFIYDQINIQLAHNCFFDVKNIIFWCSLLVIFLFFIILFVLLEKYIIIYIYENNVILNLIYVFSLSLGSYYVVHLLLPFLQDIFNTINDQKIKINVNEDITITKNETLLKDDRKNGLFTEITQDKKMGKDLLSDEIIKANTSKEVEASEKINKEFEKDIVKEKEKLDEDQSKGKDKEKTEEIIQPRIPRRFLTEAQKQEISERNRILRVSRPPVGRFFPDFDDHEDFDDAVEDFYDEFPFFQDPKKHIKDILTENEEEDQWMTKYVLINALRIIRHTLWPLLGSPKRKKVDIEKEKKDEDQSEDKDKEKNN